MTQHAKLMSPSSAHRRIACPGSYVLESALPDKVSDASDDGTAMHWVAAECLTGGREPHAFVGRYIDVHDKGEPMRRVQFTAAMAELTATYVQQIRRAASGAELLVEQRVDFSHIVGEPEQFGTLDAEVYHAGLKQLEIRDLKTGYHRVEVVRNPQMMLYALGALARRRALGDEVEAVVLAIHQPKVMDEPQEWECPLDDLDQFAQKAKQATALCKAADWNMKGGGLDFAEKYLVPGDEQCRFCKAAGTCPALRGVAARVVSFVPEVNEAALDDFEVVEGAAGNVVVPLQPTDVVEASTAMLPGATPDQLGRLLQVAPLVEIWLKQVRAEGERRLLAGQVVPGWKLVQGKRGARKWADAEAAEAKLKAMRLRVEEMFDLSLISPTSAEKLTKGDKPVIGPRQWKTLQDLIVQAEGSPSVAPAHDKRPALVITPPADDFEVIQAEPQGVEALV